MIRALLVAILAALVVLIGILVWPSDVRRTPDLTGPAPGTAGLPVAPESSPAAPSTAGEEAEAPPDPATGAARIRTRGRGYRDDFASLNAEREDVVVLPSGVQYEVLESGSGKQPEPNGRVLVQYEAMTPDGYVIDTTGDEEPASIPLGEVVVPGLQEVLRLMREGDHWLVVIPAGQGFVKTLNNRVRRRDLIVDVRLLTVQ